jgi:hypothetical protein
MRRHQAPGYHWLSLMRYESLLNICEILDKLLGHWSIGERPASVSFATATYVP